jgi:hypothetical protein
MSKETKSDTTKETNPAKAKPSTDSRAQIQAMVDKENAQGFRGVEVDPTPNENYTVAGVTSGAPTPETSPEAAGTARNVTNIGLSGIEAAQRDKDATAANAASTAKYKRGDK